MKELLDGLEFWTSHSYIELCNIALARLTLLNGRRGGETGRLLIEEGKDAEDNKWIDRQRYDVLNEGEKMLVDTLKITYLAGKGNRHIVSLVIPNDTVPALRKLSDPVIRMKAGVSVCNLFLFASTQNSEYDTSGWLAFILNYN